MDQGLLSASQKLWIDPYVGRRYESGLISTGYYFYERKKPGSWRTFTGKYDAWNELVEKLNEHQTARRIMGLRGFSVGEIDPEIGESQFMVGMYLLASHLTGKGFPTKVINTCGVYLLLQEESCTGPDRSAYCGAIIKEAHDLYEKLELSPDTISTEDIKLGIYR